MMKEKQWYESLFENYSAQYEKEVFTQGTLGECDFLEKEFNYDKRLRILDVGCGTGRHSIEMSRRGYNMTGIDLSQAMLEKARQKAKAAGLEIIFQHHDARNLPFSNEFDAAIMLCEGGFSLMETDEMNFQILQNVAKSLKKGGKFIFTTLNCLYPLYHSVETIYENNKEVSHCREKTFDLMTFRDYNSLEFTDDAGNKMTLECNERYYVPSEITWMLKSLDFSLIEIFGAKLGAYSRDEKLTPENFEMLVVAEKFK